MPPDVIDTPVARAKSAKGYWLWGSVGGAFLAWLIFWWASSHRSAMILPDGTVIRYAGFHKGERVSDTEFERDVYAYPRELVFPTPLTERLRRFFDNLTNPRHIYPNYDEYISAPELLLLHVSEAPSSKNHFRLILVDGSGYEQGLSNPYASSPIRLNHKQLSMVSSTWKVKALDQNNQTIGEFVLPNPSFKPAPDIASKSAPLESRTSQGMLKLLSAEHSVSKEGESEGWRYVTLTFDASDCPHLLPCHVIGVRVTDSSGHTALINGSLTRDGKTIRAQWRNIDGAPMQSEGWHIKIALCRGYGASFKSHEIVVFDHFLTTSGRQTPDTKLISGRLLTLEDGFWADGPRPNQWSLCRFKWRLDQKGPALWPVLVKATGRTSGGTVVDITSISSEKSHEQTNYGVMRERFQPSGCDNWKLIDFPLFEASFMSPSGLKDFDLQVALEEPQVFEFFAKVSNWPEAPKKTQD